jgi:hypothetical protein
MHVHAAKVAGELEEVGPDNIGFEKDGERWLDSQEASDYMGYAHPSTFTAMQKKGLVHPKKFEFAVRKKFYAQRELDELLEKRAGPPLRGRRWYADAKQDQEGNVEIDATPSGVHIENATILVGDMTVEPDLANEFFTTYQARRYLGYKTSKTLYMHIEDGSLQYEGRRGRAYYFTKDQLDDFLDNDRVLEDEVLDEVDKKVAEEMEEAAGGEGCISIMACLPGSEEMEQYDVKEGMPLGLLVGIFAMQGYDVVMTTLNGKMDSPHIILQSGDRVVMFNHDVDLGD